MHTRATKKEKENKPRKCNHLFSEAVPVSQQAVLDFGDFVLTNMLNPIKSVTVVSSSSISVKEPERKIGAI